jgi:tetratricopeptide (TPR) repeat protein
MSRKMKKSFGKEFIYKDFIDLAVHQDYRNLILLYKRTISKHPKLQLEEGMLNTLGLRLSFNPKKIEQGVNVLLLALHLYPESANLYDSLAEAYLYNKDFKNAILNYNKSLEFNPENQNAIDRLKQLQE